MSERRARVDHNPNGDPIIPLVLNAEELRELGVDAVGADHVASSVRDGRLHLRPVRLDAAEQVRRSRE